MSKLLTLLLHGLGWLLARSPEVLPRAFSAVLGDVLYAVMARRRRTTLSNLSHAFPEKHEAWLSRTARISFRRMVETALFTVAAPYLGERRIRERFRLAPGGAELNAELRETGRGSVVAVGHLALWEALALVPLLAGGDRAKFGTIYRPQKIEAIERWIQQSRGRFGLKLFSRKTGLLAPARFVAQGGMLGVLVDQNARDSGTLDLFLGRVASCTTLHGILAERHGALPLFSWPRRTGFWRAEVCFERLPCEPEEAAVTQAASARLGRLLREDETACESWLWSHNRWRCQDEESTRLRFHGRRSYVHGPKARAVPQPFPRSTRVLVIVGRGATGAAAFAALVPRLRASRPDLSLEAACAGDDGRPSAIDGALRALVDATFEPAAGAAWGGFRRVWRARYFDFALLLEAPAAAAETARRALVRQRLVVSSAEAGLNEPAGREPGGPRLLPGGQFPGSAGLPPGSASAALAERWAFALQRFGLESVDAAEVSP